VTAIECQYGETILKVENVSVAYDDVPVLRDLNLEIKDLIRPGYTQGQVVGLLGPSGIGKTTLFRLLAGVDKPDSGIIQLETDCRPVERGMVGVVAQHYPLFAHRTVMGNLLIAGRRAGLSASAAESQSRAFLKRFGLESQANKYPVQLSGGQRQRVAIAQQFMCSDHFLLMDEPFTGLDLLAEERLCEFIVEMAQTDELKTFIIITHDITAALSICDTIWLLGRDHDAQGNIIPGARLQATYNLVEQGIAWQKGVTSQPEFLRLLGEIRALFPRL
jgi:NitT/TauT family transport system ATP-binding protein